jgi:hypothetical protein
MPGSYATQGPYGPRQVVMGPALLQSVPLLLVLLFWGNGL